MQYWFDIWQFKPDCLSQAVALDFRLGLFERPGNVVNVCAHRLSGPVLSEETIAFSQEVFKCAVFAFYQLARWAQPSVSGLEDHLLFAKKPPAVERKLPLRSLFEPHLRPIVRQVIEGPCHRYCKQVACVQREEIHTACPRFGVDHIRAQV